MIDGSVMMTQHVVVIFNFHLNFHFFCNILVSVEEFSRPSDSSPFLKTFFFMSSVSPSLQERQQQPSAADAGFFSQKNTNKQQRLDKIWKTDKSVVESQPFITAVQVKLQLEGRMTGLHSKVFCINMQHNAAAAA